MASSSDFTTGEPQAGQEDGILNLTKSSFLCSLTDDTTSGITSPARLTITVSPIRISFLLTSSSLCKVALDTITPPTATGSNLATGVKAPVRPT